MSVEGRVRGRFLAKAAGIVAALGLAAWAQVRTSFLDPVFDATLVPWGRWMNAPHPLLGWWWWIVPVVSFGVGVLLSYAWHRLLPRAGESIEEARGLEWRVRWRRGRVVGLDERCPNPGCAGTPQWCDRGEGFGQGLDVGYYECPTCGFAAHFGHGRGNVRADAARELRRAASWRLLPSWTLRRDGASNGAG